jgi:hypothetical protein
MTLYHPRPERWPQFTLRGLLIATTLSAIFAATTLPSMLEFIHMRGADSGQNNWNLIIKVRRGSDGLVYFQDEHGRWVKARPGSIVLHDGFEHRQ